MTNKEALQSTSAGYPIDGNTFERILLDRGLIADDDYLGKNQSFELAKADLYVTLITAANVQEGGFMVSLTDKSNFMKVAAGIYSKYGEDNPLDEVQAKPTVRARNVW